MTDSEKKWIEWDESRHSFVSVPIVSKASREAYKEALRDDIERQINDAEKRYVSIDTMPEIINLRWLLSRLDLVNPPNL